MIEIKRINFNINNSLRYTQLLTEVFNFIEHNDYPIDSFIEMMDGMSGYKYRKFINLLISKIDNPRYLEIGSWKGSTLCSAISNNVVSATAIENWSQFDGPKDEFISNKNRF